MAVVGASPPLPAASPCPELGPMRYPRCRRSTTGPRPAGPGRPRSRNRGCGARLHRLCGARTPHSAPPILRRSRALRSCTSSSLSRPSELPFCFLPGLPSLLGGVATSIATPIALFSHRPQKEGQAQPRRRIPKRRGTGNVTTATLTGSWLPFRPRRLSHTPPIRCRPHGTNRQPPSPPANGGFRGPTPSNLAAVKRAGRSLDGCCTLMSAPFVKGAQSRRGVNVDPARIRQARLDRGLSLAQLARNDLSRAFIHQLEHGQSKPSRDTLQLIARRTGKPIGYFTRGAPA